MIGDEFDELMPHRILVTSQSGKNDYGRSILDPATAREYRCLLDSEEVTTRTADGTNVAVNLTAYVRSIPLNLDLPWQIEDTDTVEITDPAGVYVDRPLVSVATHFDADGTPHNFVLRFS